MKAFLLTSIMIISVNLFGQTDSCFLNVEKDKFTDAKSIQSQMVLFSNYPQAFLFFSKTKATTILAISLSKKNKTYCVKEGTEIIFLFKDNSKATVQNSNSLNCKGSYHLYFANGGVSLLDSLSIKKIAAIRFYNTDGYEDIDIDEENSNRIKNFASCILKEKID